MPHPVTNRPTLLEAARTAESMLTAIARGKMFPADEYWQAVFALRTAIHDAMAKGEGTQP